MGFYFPFQAKMDLAVEGSESSELRKSVLLSCCAYKPLEDFVKNANSDPRGLGQGLIPWFCQVPR